MTPAGTDRRTSSTNSLGGGDRTVFPVRVFWVPGGLPTRVKLAGLISGRETYRPPVMLQRAILKKDPSRARIVAGEPAGGRDA